MFNALDADVYYKVSAMNWKDFPEDRIREST